VSAVRIQFSDAPYRASHLRAPRGRGSWAFSVHRTPRDCADLVWAPSGTLGEAKRWARGGPASSSPRPIARRSSSCTSNP